MTNLQGLKIVVVTIIDFILFLRCMFQPTSEPLESYYQTLILVVKIMLIYIGVFRAKDLLELWYAYPQTMLDWLYRRWRSM